MNSITLWLKVAVVSAVLLLARMEHAAAVPVPPAASTPAMCAAPEHRQFDFWMGNWEVFEFGSPAQVARVQVNRVLDGCVLLEQYEDTHGLKGQSFTIYDASRKVWRQSWVTNRGQSLSIEGGFHAGEMVFDGTDRTAGGEERRIHAVWKPVNEGIRETAVTSIDGGKTWKPWFDLLFRPHDTKASADGEAQVVAALDTQYQAAVEKNDAATMDRILADDFVLVTGSGKTYTKADLLEEARSGQTIYEHQDDSSQTVRLWGDTAVITARLRAKGAENGKPFEYTLWFSDTYVRTPAGWRYVFGQASLRLPGNS